MKLKKWDIVFITLVAAGVLLSVFGLVKGERITPLVLMLSELTTLAVYGLYLRERKKGWRCEHGCRNDQENTKDA